MKQLFFLFTMLLVVSCSSDIYEQQIEKSNKSMKMLNRSEIVKIPKLTSKLTQIKSTQNKVQERIVTDTTYNFSVDTNTAIYINSGASETYTFNVLRENSDNKIENLLLIANSDGTFRTFLIKYDFTNSEKQTQGFDPLNYESPKYTEIEADYTQLFNNRCMYRSDFICVDTYEYERIETNGGSNAGGALFYWDWRVVATNCTFVTTSSGDCGGGGGGSKLTFETSPIHTSGGYGGVTVALSTNQRTFINALNTMSSENFSVMNGDVQMNILNYVNTLTNSQINTVAYFFNYANTLWISSQSDQTQQSIFNYLIANNFSTTSSNVIKRWIDLQIALVSNPNLLLDVPCDQLPAWQSLTQFTPPQSVITKIQQLDELSLFTDFNIQTIQSASGAVVNCDYFPVVINSFPTNSSTGLPFTPKQFLNHVRRYINLFINNTYASFSPSTITGINESIIWNSANSLGSIIHIDIPGLAGDGSVITSQHDDSTWIFTTIEVPWETSLGSDGIHPVSGNREFGIFQNLDGSYTFYTRGVDRMTDSFESVVAENTTIISNVFDNPDALWKSLTDKVSYYVQNNGGNSITPLNSDNKIWRPAWNKVSQYLNGQIPLSGLG